MVRRQKLISEDYKVSKGLVRACKEEIVEHQCFKESVTVKDRKVKLAQVLLCLENALHRGDFICHLLFFICILNIMATLMFIGDGIGGECQAEMLDHRRALLEDYRYLN